MSAPTFLPVGTVFRPEDITFWADPEHRSLDQAIAEADVLVSCPHSGAAIPGELERFLAPEFTRRLQYDYSDVATAAIVRAWARIDPRIVYVENPHPRLVRDPNRARPEDPAAQLRAALDRVREAGPYQRVDLSGVDAIRPVTFSFYPLLCVPDTEAGTVELVTAFADVAAHGLEVYEATRDALTERFLDAAAERGSGSFTRLSFHDTMNTTTTREGSVSVPRAEADRLPNVVALSNRGDHAGNARPGEAVTMDPERVRALAHAHRAGFAVADPTDVALNQPYLGSQEIIAAGERFARADLPGVDLDAVQAEFLREYLLGPAATAVLHEPGTDWPETDTAHVEVIARRCRDAWDRYRNR